MKSHGQATDNGIDRPNLLARNPVEQVKISSSQKSRLSLLLQPHDRILVAHILRVLSFALMNKPIILFFGLLVILTICIGALWTNHRKADDDKTLTLYCAAALRVPVSEIITQYENETGRTVKVIYNGSGALLSQIKIGGGDLFLPANNAYIQDAAKDNLTAESIPATQLTAVIVVAKDNTNIHSLQDLTRSGVKISFANQSSAIGKFTREILKQHPLFDAIRKNVTVTKPTVNNIIEDVALGSADATIAWDAVAKNYPTLKTIPVPIFEQKPRKVDIAVLRSSKHPAAALHFARFLTAKNKGLIIFNQHHFKTETPAKATN